MVGFRFFLVCYVNFIVMDAPPICDRVKIVKLAVCKLLFLMFTERIILIGSQESLTHCKIGGWEHKYSGNNYLDTTI